MAFVTKMLEIFYLFVMTLRPTLSYVLLQGRRRIPTKLAAYTTKGERK